MHAPEVRSARQSMNQLKELKLRRCCHNRVAQGLLACGVGDAAYQTLATPVRRPAGQ